VLELSRFLDGDGGPCTPKALLCDRCWDASAVPLPLGPSIEYRHVSEEAERDNDLGDL
jgi:hypothetical protein